MPEKLMRCIKHVKEAQRNRKKRKKVNPWAVCVASTGQKPHGSK